MEVKLNGAVAKPGHSGWFLDTSKSGGGPSLAVMPWVASEISRLFLGLRPFLSDERSGTELDFHLAVDGLCG